MDYYSNFPPSRPEAIKEVIKKVVLDIINPKRDIKEVETVKQPQE